MAIYDTIRQHETRQDNTIQYHIRQSKKVQSKKGQGNLR